MDIVQLISEQATSVSLAILVMWFYNKLVLDFLAERKEMIEEIRAERKEWLEKSDKHLSYLFDVANRSIETVGGLRAEVHALKNEITKLVLNLGRDNQRGSERP